MVLKQPAEPLPQKADSTATPSAQENGVASGQENAVSMKYGEPAAALTPQQAKAAERAERAAKIISVASLLLLFLAVAMYAVIAFTGFNPYIAAAALFCAGAAGYPLLTLLTYAVASQTSRAFTRLGPYDRFVWAQKVPTILHAVTMSAAGLRVVRPGNWAGRDLLTGRDELVAAFLGLELAFLLQDLGLEVYKQARFGRSMPALRWARQAPLLALLPLYYRRPRADFFLGLLFALSAAIVPSQLRWFFQAAGVRRSALLQRAATAVLILTYLATHVGGALYALALHCRSQRIPWSDIPTRVPMQFLAGGGVFITCSLAWLAFLLSERRPATPPHKKAS